MKKMLFLMAATLTLGFSQSALAVDGKAVFQSKGCVGCHPQFGAVKAATSKIAGLPKDRIVASLNSYQAGKTVGPQSQMMISNAGVKSLTAEEITAVADFLSSN